METDPMKCLVVTWMVLVWVFDNDVDPYYEKMLEGESGIDPIDRFDPSKFPMRFFVQIRGNSSEGYIEEVRRPFLMASSHLRALNWASNASLVFSFSFTGFTVQPEDIAEDLKVFSDEETTAIDPEARGNHKRIITEPMPLIYLKVLYAGEDLAPEQTASIVINLLRQLQ